MPRESAFFLASESVCLSFDIFGSTFRRKAKIEMILSRALHTSDSLAVSPQEGDAGKPARSGAVSRQRQTSHQKKERSLRSAKQREKWIFSVFPERHQTYAVIRLGYSVCFHRRITLPEKFGSVLMGGFEPPSSFDVLPVELHKHISHTISEGAAIFPIHFACADRWPIKAMFRLITFIYRSVSFRRVSCKL